MGVNGVGVFSETEFNPGDAIGVLIETRREKYEYEGCNKVNIISSQAHGTFLGGNT